MPFVDAIDRPVYWAVGDPIVASGLTDVGETTVTGLTMVNNVDENTFLGAVAGSAGTYNPLPSQGDWCEAGVIYGYGGGLVICRQSHWRDEHDPADIPALFAVYRAGGGVLEWIAGERVEVGTRRTYNTILYTCLVAHQTQSDWTPIATLGTLWGVVNLTSEWVSGEQGIKIGDLRTYQGVTYRCVQNPGINIWPPPTVPALWTQV